MMHIKLKKSLFAPEGEMLLDIDFRINDGDFLTIYGESGAGKTSVLRMIAGLMNPDDGEISVKGQYWYQPSEKINISPQKRKVGIVFQDFALFPNMTVRENLKYALDKKNSRDIIDELIGFSGLDNLQNNKPETLSGGQKQRVALARAIVSQPQLLLLDEPLSALDITMRQKLQDFLLEIHKRFNLTIVMVSHDVSEVYKLSNRIIKLSKGKIVQEGSPAEVFFNNKISGKFQFTGEVLRIDKEDIIFVISILIGHKIVKVVSTEEDIANLSVGDQVLVASKAFNPIIKKIKSHNI